MARLTALLRADLTLQWRRGFHAAYALVTLFYIGALRALPEGLGELAAVAVLFTDPAVLGCFFVGGLTLLERGEGSLHALFLSPLATRDWLLSKALSLGALAVLASALIAGLGVGGVRWGWLVPGVAGVSTCFVLLGVVAVSRFATVNQYIGGAVLWATPMFLPILPAMDGEWSAWTLLLPTGAGLELIAAGFMPREPARLGLALLSLTAWTALAGLWAQRWLERYTLERG